jgi:prepilin-type N-terminal cleavage/methylation domain-containing protein
MLYTNAHFRVFHQAAGSHRGFSLIEIFVVICIIAIMAALSMPSMSNFIANRELKNATRDIVGEFFEFKERALSESRVFQIAFDVDSNSYTIQRCRDIGAHCESKVFEDIATRNMSAFKGNIKIEHAAFGTGSTIRFQTRGTANPGSVRLKNRLESEARVVVNITGRTRVEWALK